MQGALATYQDFVPTTELVEEPECNTLLVYLPGYKKEQLKVQVTGTRNLVIHGLRPVGENTWQRFQKRIPLSTDCDIDKISAKFEDIILRIRQPKLIASAEKQDQEKPTNNHENLKAEKQDREKATTTKTAETYKHVDKVKQVSGYKQADDTKMERKETAEDNVEKLKEEENISGIGEDTNAKTVSDKISMAEQTKNTAETEKTKGSGDQKHITHSGIFATKLNMRKEVINIVIAVFVAIAFGLYVNYSVGRCVKQDV